MIAIRNILCPVDFSDFSKRALDHAMAIARATTSGRPVWPSAARVMTAVAHRF